MTLPAHQIKATLREAVGHYQSNRLTEAKRLCHQVLAADPQSADANHLWGVLAMRDGELEAAIKSIARAVEISPANMQYHNSLGVAFSKNRQFAQAVHHFWLVLAREPKNIGAMQNLAQSLREAGYAKEAMRVSQEAIALDPNASPDPAWLCEVGRQFRESGQYADAMGCYRRAVSLKSDFLMAHLGLIQTLDEAGNASEALAANDALMAVAPDQPEAYKNRAVLLIQLGKIKEARGCLEKALELSPENADAFRLLTQIKKSSLSDPAIPRMAGLCARDSVPEDEKKLLHFAMGKVYEDAGDYDKAFMHYFAGNSIHRRKVNYEAKETVNRIDALTKYFTREKFVQIGNRFAVDSDLPVFVVGMPRSGTSLVEQVLSSHPAVFGAGELPHLRKMLDRLQTLTVPSVSFPFCLDRVPPATGRELAQQYVDELRRLAPQARRVSDKMPWNFHMLGLIAMFWPKARIVHCVRDPMDTCLSCYTRFFAVGQPFAWDLIELGHYCRHQQRLAAHWRETLPVPILEVRYEELVSDPEPVCRRLIEFCGLPWDARCLEFYRTERPVKTESGVREPVYRTSVGRWQRYGDHLEPLRQALEGQIQP